MSSTVDTADTSNADVVTVGAGTAGPHVLTSPDGRLTALVNTRGAHIASIRHTPSGTELLYRRDPAAYPDAGSTAPGSNEAWHAGYPGGWHGLLPHSGDERTVDGVEHPFHGEAAWRDWDIVSAGEDRVRLRISLDTAPVELERDISVAGARLTVTQRVTSRAPGDTAISWAEHPAFGAPLVGPATRVSLDGTELPLVFPTPGDSHGAFATHAVGADATALISNQELGLDVTMRWDGTLFPHTFIWQEHRASDGFPWWGEADVMAIEPSVRPYHPEGDALGPLVIRAGERISSIITIDVAAHTTGTVDQPQGGTP